jgi:hypothetical protein
LVLAVISLTGILLPEVPQPFQKGNRRRRASGIAARNMEILLRRSAT